MKLIIKQFLPEILLATQHKEGTCKVYIHLNKKLKFHQTANSFTHLNTHDHYTNCTNKRIKNRRRKAKSRQQNRQNRSQKRQEYMKEKVDAIINNNVVVNLSSWDVPDLAYLYLAKGLNFIPSKDLDKYDLKYDALDFTRKLAWRSYHHLKGHPDLADQGKNIHSDLSIKSKKHPDDSHPLLKEIKNKILNWVDNLEQSSPRSNLTEGEKRGYHWVRKMVKEKNIFITKADKGGAILVMNYDDVVGAVENDLADIDQFEPIMEDALKVTEKKVKELVMNLDDKGYIQSKDKTMISGLNENNNMKRNAAYRAQPTHIYPFLSCTSCPKKRYKLRRSLLTD